MTHIDFELPYGLYLVADGSTVLFNRRYAPMYVYALTDLHSVGRGPRKAVTLVEPYHVDYIAHVWFRDDEDAYSAAVERDMLKCLASWELCSRRSLGRPWVPLAKAIRVEVPVLPRAVKLPKMMPGKVPRFPDKKWTQPP